METITTYIRTNTPLLLLVFASLSGVLGQCFLKNGALEVHSKSISIYRQFFNFQIIIGLTIYGCAAVAYIYSLRKIPLSVAYPTMSLGYVATALIGKFYFSETLPATHVVGICLIILGTLFLWK